MTIMKWDGLLTCLVLVPAWLLDALMVVAAVATVSDGPWILGAVLGLVALPFAGFLVIAGRALREVAS